MAKHTEFESGDAGKYTVTAFISFVVLLVVLFLMMQWHGYYQPTNNVDTKPFPKTHTTP